MTALPCNFGNHLNIKGVRRALHPFYFISIPIGTPMSEQNNKPNLSPEEVQAQVNAFYERADAFINLANSQLSPQSHAGQVGSSLLYASARYSASVASIGFANADDFAKEKDDIIKFYTAQYQQMLSDNLDDYITNCEKYTNIKKS